MFIAITTISILAITSAIWLLNRILPFKVCPICAGVSGTWLLLSAASLSGYAEFPDLKLVIAILMGGTVAGSAYVGERVIRWAESNHLLWKIAVIVPGFLWVYFAVDNLSWTILALESAALAVLAYVLFIRPFMELAGARKKPLDPKKIKDLEKKLKNCC